MAQQVQVEKHSKTPLAYPEFRDGAITFTFGTTKTYKAAPLTKPDAEVKAD